MRYQGSKARIAKDIIPFFSKHLKDGKVFIDLFAGGMNLVDKVNYPYKVATDINYYVISLWQEIQKNGMKNIPMEVTEEMYNDVKNKFIDGKQEYPDYLTGYVATCCSYGGGWFNGYAHFNPNKNEDHIKEAYNGLKKQFENFKYLDKTVFAHYDYVYIEELVDLKDAVIYADPPYESRKAYIEDFDNFAFWNWVRCIVKDFGTPIYISEYDAPSDFKCVWQKNVPDGMGTTKNGRKQNRKIEKLFVYNG